MRDSEGLKNDVYKMPYNNGRAIYWFFTYKFSQRGNREEMSEVAEQNTMCSTWTR